MKQQNRPFVVEIKQKRALVKRPESIWAGIDLAALAKDVAEAKTDSVVAEATSQPISPGEDLRSRLMLTTGEAVSEVRHVILPVAPPPEGPSVERALVPEVSNAPAGVRWPPRKKRQEDVPLPRGEKWKRRLPWVLRPSRRKRRRQAD
ncbi:hypothetical protein [Mesorhizobium sp. M0208]|uniref:hypothetical protein n=1 Tax=Mesorhizobium sp. M0208 TaxID=2956916 RepID=UPI00333B9F10